MYLNEMRQKGIFRKKFFFGDVVGEDKESVWVEMRGPNSEEMIALTTVAEGERGKALLTLMQQLVVAHNIEVDEGKPASDEAVYHFIAAMPELHTEISNALMSEIPLAVKNRESSDKSPA